VRGRWHEARGADRGVDGRIGLWNLKGEYREGVVQVKGGNSCTLSAVRDFRGVIEREQAVLGIMICQREPTKEMLLEAGSMGFADWPDERKIPRYQILTTEGILERRERPILPESYLAGPDKGVGKAVRGQTEALFDPND
jgi:site-specific DNA-methyltransferase (adenine-specific)